MDRLVIRQHSDLINEIENITEYGEKSNTNQRENQHQKIKTEVTGRVTYRVREEENNGKGRDCRVCREIIL